MKKLIFFMLFPIAILAQEGIFMKDGSTVKVTTETKIFAGKNKLYYKDPEKRRKSVKYKKLDYAAWDGKMFRSVQDEGKSKGYFLIADEHGHSLAVFAQNRTKYTGGFQSPYRRYDVAELRNGEVIQKISFTNSAREDNPAKRREAYEMITRNFSQCKKLVDRIPAGEPSESILALLDQTSFIPCD